MAGFLTADVGVPAAVGPGGQMFNFNLGGRGGLPAYAAVPGDIPAPGFISQPVDSAANPIRMPAPMQPPQNSQQAAGQQAGMGSSLSDRLRQLPRARLFELQQQFRGNPAAQGELSREFQARQMQGIDY